MVVTAGRDWDERIIAANADDFTDAMVDGSHAGGLGGGSDNGGISHS